MPEMHLRQPGFTYSACGLFTKCKERIQKFKETADSKYTYQNKIGKACFKHDMDYGYFKDLPKRTTYDKVSHNKTFNIAKIRNMMDIKEVLAQWFINFLINGLQVVLLKMKLCHTKT